jgi:hypothetical protein
MKGTNTSEGSLELYCLGEGGGGRTEYIIIKSCLTLVSTIDSCTVSESYLCDIMYRVFLKKTCHLICYFCVSDFLIRGPFAKFVDSPYYSESELCGGAVTVSFSKYLPWQEMHSLQRSTPLLENVLQTVDHFEI